MKPLVSITLSIKGRPWTFKLFSDRVFDKIHNSDPDPEKNNNGAMTVPIHHEVHFPKSEWSVLDIRHELGHVFKFECNTESSVLDADQTEELMCEIIGTHAQEICLLSDQIANKFLIYQRG